MLNEWVKWLVSNCTLSLANALLLVHNANKIVSDKADKLFFNIIVNTTYPKTKIRSNAISIKINKYLHIKNI